MPAPPTLPQKPAPFHVMSPAPYDGNCFSALITAAVNEHDRLMMGHEMQKQELRAQLQMQKVTLPGDDLGENVPVETARAGDYLSQRTLHNGAGPKSTPFVSGNYPALSQQKDMTDTNFAQATAKTLTPNSTPEVPKAQPAETQPAEQNSSLLPAWRTDDVPEPPQPKQVEKKKAVVSASSCLKAFENQVSKEAEFVDMESTKLRRFMSHWYVESSIFIIILSSIFVSAFEIQYVGLNFCYRLQYFYCDVDPKETWVYADVFFIYFEFVTIFIFTVEFVLRCFAFRMEFARTFQFWVDGLIVCSGLATVAADSLAGGSINLQYLRMMRLVKVARILRGLKFFSNPRVFDCLRMLMEAIAASMGALFWSMSILMVIQCMFAMTMSQLVQSYLEEVRTDPDLIRRQIEVYKYYGTFTRAFLSTMEIMLANWSPPCRALVENMGEIYGIPILLYRCCAGFAVLNVISAVFIQQTMKVAQSDTEVMIMEKKRATEGYQKKLTSFFKRLDASGDGVLSLEEFQSMLSEPTLSSWLDALGIDPNHLGDFFEMLDNGDGDLTVDEFVEGASRVRGQAQSIDLAYLMHSSRKLEYRVSCLLECIQQKDPSHSIKKNA